MTLLLQLRSRTRQGQNALVLALLSILRLWRSTADMNRIIGMLKAGGLCSDVLYKELYIPQAEIDGEHPRSLSIRCMPGLFRQSHEFKPCRTVLADQLLGGSVQS